MRLENHIKEIYVFDEEYTTKRDTKTTENQGRGEWEGINVHAGLLLVLVFMGKLFFRKRVAEAVGWERGANAQCQVVDIVQDGLWQ